MEHLDGNGSLPCIGMDQDQTAHGSLNISDVIEVLQTTDPEFVGATSHLYNNSVTTMEDTRKKSAYVTLLEQPASKALRFRYECEGRSAGSIPGVNSTPENKTFPSIQVVGYKGRAVVVVSCVTKDPPYRPHPHNLVGKEGCKKGVCTVEMNNENMSVTFSNLGIQCVKKKDIEEALRVREEIRVDPYRTGFAHRSQPTSIDLNAVRLCFQVFLEGPVRNKFTVQLDPIVSDPIFDKKAMSDLVICKLSDCSCSVAGGKEIILLCEKVAKEDIQVRFYEERSGHVMWEGFGDFQPTQVHKQVAISFRSPRYSSLEVDAPIKINIQLRRPSDGATSEPLPFEFLPLDSDPVKLKRKRQKFGTDHRQFQDNLSRLQAVPAYSMSPSPELAPPHLLQVKREPLEPNPAGYMFVSEANYGPQRVLNPTPSPQPSPASGGRTPSPMDCMTSALTFQGGNVFNYARQPEYASSICRDNSHQTIIHPSPLSFVSALQRVEAAPGLQPSNNLNVGNYGPPMMMGDMNRNNGTTTMGLPVEMLNMVQNMGETNSILDLDSHQYSLGQLDSTEFANLDLYDAHLSENLSSNLTLSDTKPLQEVVRDNESQENMTDSYTRKTIQELCDLNNLCKGGDN